MLTEADYRIFLDILIREVLPRMNYLDKLQILEACCGTGMFGRKIINVLRYKKRIIITGVDISNNAIDYLRKLKIKNYLPICENILRKDLFNDNFFNIIICPFALHHFLKNELKVFIKNAHRWLKLGGVVIAIEPNGSNPILGISSKVGEIYKFIFPGNKYISPHEKVYSCRFYNKIFLSFGFTKIYEARVRIRGKLPPMGFIIKLLVVIKNHLSGIFGSNVVVLVYKKI